MLNRVLSTFLIGLIAFVAATIGYFVLGFLVSLFYSGFTTEVVFYSGIGCGIGTMIPNMVFWFIENPV